MFRKILVVCSESELRNQLVSTVAATAQEASAGVTVYDARHVSDAKQKAKETAPRYDLVIVHVDLAERHDTAVDPAARQGLQLLQDWHAAGWKPASILVSGIDDIHLRSESCKLLPCEFLSMGYDLDEELRQLMHKLAGVMNSAMPRSTRQPARDLVTIDLASPTGRVIQVLL